MKKIIAGKDINLELIKSCPIGTKVSGKDRTTYLQLIKEEVGYLGKNGVEDENSYSNKAVVDFLKQSNNIIFSYPPAKEQINIINWHRVSESATNRLRKELIFYGKETLFYFAVLSN